MPKKSGLKLQSEMAELHALTCQLQFVLLWLQNGQFFIATKTQKQ